MLWFLSVPLTFAYRYWIICRKSSIRKRQAYIIMTSSTATVMLLMAWNTYQNIAVEDYEESKTAGGNFIVGIESRYSAANLSKLVMFVTVNCLVYAVVIFCIYRINSVVSDAVRSAQLRALHKQLTRAMVTQVMLTFLLTTVPITLVVVSFYGEWETLTFSTFYNASTPWLISIHPLVCLWFLKAFRNSVVETFKSTINTLLSKFLPLKGQAQNRIFTAVTSK
ncbi:hypothetical protein Tcan_10950 [Toxocara canis]|nr:hypothetical protein Tcan_10950 [Toxocara canis]